MAANQILLVEDNADDETLMLDALSRCGMSGQVTVVRDGSEALDYLLPKEGQKGCAAVPKLVLLDLKLPKIGGLEVLRRLRAEARTRFVPVVVLTSSSEHVDISESYTYGANAYVRKPLDFPQFVDTVRCLEKFWLEMNQTVL